MNRHDAQPLSEFLVARPRRTASLVAGTRNGPSALLRAFSTGGSSGPRTHAAVPGRACSVPPGRPAGRMRGYGWGGSALACLSALRPRCRRRRRRRRGAAMAAGRGGWRAAGSGCGARSQHRLERARRGGREQRQFAGDCAKKHNKEDTPER